MFSKACEYGIRAIAIIAKSSEEGRRVGIKELCERANTPESFTAKILQGLVKQNIIKSQKGRSGGFYIDKELDEISLKEVVVAIDGPEIFIGCGLGLDKCDSSNPCPIHDEFEKVRTSLIHMCQQASLSVVVNQLSEAAFKR